MLILRKHSAGGPSNSTGNGSLKDDSPTTGHTSPSPTTEGSPTISLTTSLTEHTTTVDSGTTESTSKSSGSSSTSNAGAPATETQSTPNTTEKHHESSSSLTTSTAVLTTSTTNTHPSDSSSSSTTAQPEQTSTTSNLLTTSQASTTTTVTQPTPTTTTEHPPESSTSLTTSKVEPTTRTQDSPPPLPSNPSTTPETRTTDIQVTTSTADNLGTSNPISSPLTTPKPTPTTDSHSTLSTTKNSGSSDPPPVSSSPLTTSTTGYTTHSQPTIVLPGTTESPPEPSSSPTTSQVGQPAPTTGKPTDTTLTAIATGPKTAISVSDPLQLPTSTSPSASPGSTHNSSTNSIHNPIATSDSVTINSTATTDPPQAGSTSQNQPAVTTSSPDGGKNPLQLTQPGDPRPSPTGITGPLNSTNITTVDLVNLYNANNTPTPTATGSDTTSTRGVFTGDPTMSKLTTSVTTGVVTITMTYAGNGTPSFITSLSSFTQTTIFPVTDGPAPSTFTSSRSNKTATVAGGVVGGLVGLLLIFVVIFFFLRGHRRRARNDVLYGPVVPHNFSSSEVQTREFLPARAVTPFLWPQDLPRASNESIAPVSDAGRGIIGSSDSEAVTNPFEPTSSTHKLVDVDSVRSLRNSRASNPFEDSANSYLAGYPRQDSFDTTNSESGTWPGGENSGGNASSSVTVTMIAQADHLRHLSNASTDCLYPVLEPNTLIRRVSSRSELSYATLDPERVANPQAQQPIKRYPSTSSTSSSNVNVGYAV